MTNINPEILIWARETAGLSVDEAAAKLGFKDTKKQTAVEKLANFEAGNVVPERPVLLKMAKHYRRSFLTFYLAAPPKKGNRGQDFRTLKGSDTANAMLDALIRDIMTRQHLVRTGLVDEDAIPLKFIESKKIEDGIEQVASSITNTLGINLTEFRAQRKPEAAFNLLRTKVEEAGIFVLLISNLGSHHSTIGIEIFRGFAIADIIAPFVVVNDQDAKTAWCFTLLHELVHIWLGQTGVSGNFSEMKIEQFCNDVAAEILFPKSEISTINIAQVADFNALVAIISTFANDRNLSCVMVSYRFYRNGIIDKDTWNSLNKFFIEEWKKNKAKEKEKPKNDDKGPAFYAVRKHKLGKALLDFVNRTITEGILTPAKAGKVLGVKPRTVEPLLSYTPTPRKLKPEGVQ